MWESDFLPRGDATVSSWQTYNLPDNLWNTILYKKFRRYHERQFFFSGSVYQEEHAVATVHV